MTIASSTNNPNTIIKLINEIKLILTSRLGKNKKANNIDKGIPKAVQNATLKFNNINRVIKTRINPIIALSTTSLINPSAFSE